MHLRPRVLPAVPDVRVFQTPVPRKPEAKNLRLTWLTLVDTRRGSFWRFCVARVSDRDGSLV